MICPPLRGIVVLPAAQLGGSSRPRVLQPESVPLLAWTPGNIGVWTVGHSGLDLELASSFIRPTYSWLNILPVSLLVHWKCLSLEAGPTMIVTQEKVRK